jgi:putative hydrolase of the HAD superfamily
MIIIFDLDDTLYNATWLTNKSRRGGLLMMQEKGLQLNIEKAMQVLNQIVEEFGSNSSDHYDIFLQRIKNLPDIVKNQDFSISKYIAAGIMGYHKIKVRYLKPYKDVKESLEKLKELGFKLSIISDGIAVKQYEKLLRLNITDYFDWVFITDEVGIKKPNPELFKYCIEKMNVSPSDTIYVGDNLDKDIEPCNAIGMHTVLIHRGGKYDPNFPKNKIQSTVKPEFEIHSLSEIFKIIEVIQKTNLMEDNYSTNEILDKNE